jgi:hypothetical protein
MHREASEPRASGGSRLERAVVLELLGDEAEHRRSIGDLGESLGANANEIEAAVTTLTAAGVLCLEKDRTWASDAARRLDELELIAI